MRQRLPSLLYINGMSTFFTIGHSTRPLAAFGELLQAAKVELVADVRTVPRSRTNPQYNRETLPAALEAFHIGYRHFPALGGLRPKARDVPPNTNAFWRNTSFHNYADYALSEAFRAGFEELRTTGANQHCAIMCAETLWWRCHRRIITDYLIYAGEKVFHILGPGHVEPATLTPAARPATRTTLVYPADAPDLFD
jgi:uncharacterized protein (DUF488 family)